MKSSIPFQFNLVIPILIPIPWLAIPIPIPELTPTLVWFTLPMWGKTKPAVCIHACTTCTMVDTYSNTYIPSQYSDFEG